MRVRAGGMAGAQGLTRRQAAVLGIVGLAMMLCRPAQADDDDSDGKGKDKGEGDQADKDDDETLAQKAAQRFPQPVAVGALLGRKVLQPLESQPILGTVKAIVRGSDRTISAVIDYGGILGFGARRIAVPIDAMALLSPAMEIVDFEPDELDKFPTFDPEGSTPLPPGAIIRVGLAKPSH